MGTLPDETELDGEVDRIFTESSPDIEVKVRMININYGRNKELLSACRPLREYAWFVARIRECLSSQEDGGAVKPYIDEAIDCAIDDMPNDFVIRDFILSNKAEVKDMCLTEYNEIETMELIRLEALQEGQRNTMLLNIRNLMDSLGLSADKCMDILKISAAERPLIHAWLSEIHQPAE